MFRRLAALVCVCALALVSALPVTAQSPAPAQSAAKAAVVVPFESEQQVNDFAAKGTTVVFFFATWCPNCRATVAELNARWTEVNPDLTLVIADYDQEKDLKAKFGVTYQDTFVLLDKDGNGVKTWNSGGVDGLNANSKV